MNIKRNVSLAISSENRVELRKLGIVPNEVGPIFNFHIDEIDPRWPPLARWLENIGHLLCGAYTIFSKEEFQQANHFEIGADWQHGYPQPADDFGYQEFTYDLRDYCSDCGIGKVQRAPFRLKGEPKWGSRHIMGLNWVFDALFVRPGVWATVFEPLGVQHRVVLHHRTGQALTSVVQLVIDSMADPSPHFEDYHFEVCDMCGRRKYQQTGRGFFPPLMRAPSLPLFRTSEYFGGSGHVASQALIGSAEVYQALQTHQIKGAWFTPLGETEP